MLTKEALEKFNSINLLERFKQISESFQAENLFEDYSNEIIIERFKSLGYDFKYNKKEAFFGLQHEDGKYIFRFNLSLKFGIIETIMWAKNTVSGEEYGGVFSRLMKLIQKFNGAQNIVTVLYPRFSSYEEFEEIVKNLMLIFEDFKTIIKSDTV
jgi:hypothetical protein